MNRCFSKEDIQMDNRHMKKCSTSLGLKEIQIKTTMRYHLTLVRMVKINNSGNNRYWWGCRERRTLSYCWWESKLVQPLWRTVKGFLKNLKIQLSYKPAIVLLSIYPKDTNIVISRDTCTPVFIAAVSTRAKLWKELRCPLTDEWIEKIWYIYIYIWIIPYI